MTERESDYKPMKSTGIREWLLAQQEAGIMNEMEVNRLLELNEHKYERLNAHGLPAFATTGTCESLGEAIKHIPTDKWGADKFLVRCMPKDVSSKEYKLERQKNLAFDDIPNWVEARPGGKEHYSVEIREYWDADYSGTIIADGESRINIEQKPGNHAQFETADNTIIKTATYDNNAGGAIHFDYGQNPTIEQKEIMMAALKYLVPTITREQLEKIKIYAEYVYSKTHGFKFLEVNDDKYWTRLDARPIERDLTGD